MSKNIITLFGLVAVIAIAGCVGTGGGGKITEGYPGVLIKDFSPVLSNVRAGSPIDLFVTVQNQGYYDATNANVIIFNCGPSNTGSATTKTGVTYNCNDKLFSSDFSLAMPDREVGIEGEVKEAEVLLATSRDDFPKGTSPQTFTARVTYDYQEGGAIDVAFATFENLKQTGGKITTGPLNSFSNPSPLTLLLNAPRDPVIINDPAVDQPEFTVGLSIHNTGGGFVNDKTLSEIKLCYNPAIVEPIREESGNYGDFEHLDAQTNCLTIDGTSEKAKLVGLTNQYRDVDAQFRPLLNTIKIQDVTTFTTELKYTYSLDRSTTVTISNT